MRKVLSKRLALILSLVVVTTSLVGCGKKIKVDKPNNVSVVEDNEVDKKDEENEEKEELVDENLKDYEVTNGEGVATKEVLEEFKTAFQGTVAEDFKVKYVTEKLAYADRVIEALPATLKDDLFTSDGLLEYENPAWKWNMQSTPFSKSDMSAENSLYGVMLDITCSDDPSHLYAATDTTVIFETNGADNIVLSDNAYKVLQVIDSENSKEFWKEKLTEALTTGEKITIEDSKYKEVYITKSNSTLYLYVNTYSDYPQE